MITIRASGPRYVIYTLLPIYFRGFTAVVQQQSQPRIIDIISVTAAVIPSPPRIVTDTSSRGISSCIPASSQRRSLRSGPLAQLSRLKGSSAQPHNECAAPPACDSALQCFSTHRPCRTRLDHLCRRYHLALTCPQPLHRPRHRSRPSRPRDLPASLHQNGPRTPMTRTRSFHRLWSRPTDMDDRHLSQHCRRFGTG